MCYYKQLKTKQRYTPNCNIHLGIIYDINNLIIELHSLIYDICVFAKAFYN